MRAMQIIEWGKPLETREYPDPEPKGEEVLLRVEAAGVCHSDVHIWDGYFDLGGERRISLESRGVHLRSRWDTKSRARWHRSGRMPPASRSATRWWPTHGLGAGNVRYAGRARNCYASTRAPSAPDEPAAMEHT